MPTLHVVVPIYNEYDTLNACLDRVVAVTLPDRWHMDLHLVDDHSEDGAYVAAQDTANRLEGEGHSVMLTRHEVNRGKGAALQTGFDAILDARGPGSDLVVIQDADLEYDPLDFLALMKPIVAGETRVVLGTRWAEPEALKGLKRRVHAWGNGMLTRMSNAVTGYRVTDMECCYKMMTVDVLRRLRPMLTEERFGIEPQMVAGFSRLREPIVEVPISYDPRGLSAGKKIGWTDGVRAIYVIGRERLRGRNAAAIVAPAAERQT